jgi:integrase
MGYQLYQRDGGTRWQAYFIDRAGKRHRCSTKQTDKRKATVVADEWYRKLADPTYSAAHATTIQSAAGDLIEALKRAKRSNATTGHFYPVKLSHLARVWGEDMPLARIDAKLVDGYIATREEEGASPHTISKELTALRQLLKHARRRGEFDKELSQVMPIGFATGYVPRTRRLTIPEARRFIEELPDNIRRYVAYVCATTARDAAVGRARGRHLTAEGIHVLDRKTKGSTRIVPLNAMTEPFARYAFEGVAPDAPVCPGITSVRHAFDRATKRLGIAHVSPNDLRRSVAHWLLERGVPRDAAAAFMGHANTKMLDAVYGKLDATELGLNITRALAASGQISNAERGDTCTGAAGTVDDPCKEKRSSGSDDKGSHGGSSASHGRPKSTVEETWKTGSESVDRMGQVDGVTLEKQCAGAESNRRHGDFQSPTFPQERAHKGHNSSESVDGLWNRGPLSEFPRASEAPAVDVSENHAGDIFSAGPLPPGLVAVRVEVGDRSERVAVRPWDTRASMGDRVGEAYMALAGGAR